MSGQTHPLFPLRSGQLHQAGGVLSRAFFDDPLMTCYLPDPARRALLLPTIMLAAIRYSFLYGQVFTTSRLEGLACWLPPGRTTMTAWRMLRAGLGQVPFQLGLEALQTIRKVEPVIDRIHKACLPGPHWYLMMLGVEPSSQGKGIGGRLVEAKLDEIHKNGLPAYLETMTEQDVAFYSKRGFRVVFDLDLLPGGLHTWMMISD
jgi:ribosomal protein S18 acetylase RimI-like enzyme